MLAYLVRPPDCWVAKRDVFLALYGHRPPEDRPEPKILDVYCTMARRAISAALGTPLPARSHYLVSNHRGKVGLFSAPQPMGYARGPRGKVNGTLRELYRLLEPPPKPPEPRFA